MIMITITTKSRGSLTFETIFRHLLDQQNFGQVDALAVACARTKIENTMLNIIKRRGLMDTLLVELGLCSLCAERQARRVER